MRGDAPARAQLGAAPRGRTDVLEGRSASSVGRHADFVVGARLEHREVRSQAACIVAPLRAELDLLAGLRLQPIVEAAAAVGPVGQFTEGRRFEALAGADIEVPVRQAAPLHCSDRVGVAVLQRARVVAVETGHIVIVRLEAHTAGARAERCYPVLDELQFALGVKVGGLHGVLLVAALVALDAERRGRQRIAEEVLVAATVLGAAFQCRAGHELGAAVAIQRPAPDQPAVEALVVAIEVDHAARVPVGVRRRRRVALGQHGDGLPLRDRSLPDVGRDGALIQRTEVRKAMPPRGADLLLLRDLAGVELRGDRGRLARIGVKLRAVQAQRIVGGLVDVVHADDHRVALAGPAQAQVGERAARAALRAEAVVIHVARAEAQVEAAARLVAERCLHRHAPLAQAEAADVRAELAIALPHRLAHQRDDAARTVAVERAERAAQHLDALCSGEVEVRHLPLAVGHRGRDAVAVEAHAAHAEGRTGPVAARVDLQVLRVVVSVRHGQARHSRHRFRQIDHRARVAQHLLVDGAHRIRRVEGALLEALAGHDHGRERPARRLLRLQQGRSADQGTGGDHRLHAPQGGGATLS